MDSTLAVILNILSGLIDVIGKMGGDVDDLKAELKACPGIPDGGSADTAASTIEENLPD